MVIEAQADALIDGSLDLPTFVASTLMISGATDLSDTRAALQALTGTGAGVLTSLFEAALAEGGDPDDAAAQIDLGTPKLTQGTYYLLRCVFERPRCKGIHPPVVSEPTEPVELAPYFDPEAPARPLQITLPVDTSIGGLREFPKGVSMLLSDSLRAQLERMEGIKLSAIDDGDIGPAGSLNLGMICSLSIPIITIVALILLMIFVFLLNLIFWWVPLLKICFPLKLSKG